MLRGSPIDTTKDHHHMTDTYPGHIPATDLAALLNNDGHKQSSFLPKLHKLVAKHAVTTIDIATGTIAHHPRHGKITIISAHPTTTGHVIIAVPRDSSVDGVELHTVYAHELTTDQPPLPSKLTTRQHYRQAPIGTRVTVTAGDSAGISYTKKGPSHWAAGHMYAELGDDAMTQFCTILDTPDTDQ